MHILLLNQFFCPDSAPTSQLLTDVARELVGQGHTVTVICGGSTYADAGSAEAPGVTVRRVKNLGFGRGKIRRLCSYISFLALALLLGLREPKPELILSMTTPPGLSSVGALIAWFRRTRHFIWEMDVYPDVAEALGVLKPEWRQLTRFMRWAFDLPRRWAHGIITLGECMAWRMEAHGLAQGKIHIAENWADGRAFPPIPFRDDGVLTLLYSGNLGLVHELDTVRQAILQLRNNERVNFVFAGGGKLRGAFESYCGENHLTQVSFEGYCEREKLGRRFAEAHIGLVTQKEKTMGCVVPSKAYGIMAAGRPLLFVGPADSTVGRMIRRFQCGWQVDCENSDGLTWLIETLSKNPGFVREAGRRAREAFIAHYDMPLGVERVCEILGCPVARPLEVARQYSAAT